MCDIMPHMSEQATEHLIIPRHVAFIMDGNGRWAKKRGLPRSAGHKAACERLKDVFLAVKEYGIPYASLYAFSTENWNRPQKEINLLMGYLVDFCERDFPHLAKEGVRLLHSGRRDRLPSKTLLSLDKAVNSSKDNSALIVNVCLDYGGRDELANAAKRYGEDLLAGKVKLEEMNEETLRHYLYHPELPDVDLLIRTSGEERISNFLLYELAYAELCFTPTYWPDFGKEELGKALEAYQHRNRRFGRVSA